MASRTPVEIWSKILNEAIYVPLFFEEDPAESHGILSLRKYYHELPYWESERIRNLLRRVCKGWNSYLQQFNHRYVRLTDVYHNRIPVDAIPLAIRLNSLPQWDCFCSKCTFGGESAQDYMIDNGDIVNTMTKLLGEAATRNESETTANHWFTKILDGGLSGDGWEFRLLRRVAPNLRTILGWKCAGPTPLSDLPNGLKCLVSDSEIYSLHEFTSQITAQLSSLTTLFFRMEAPFQPITSLELPCLRHLIVIIHEDYEPLEFVDVMESLLEHVGFNLRSLVVERWKNIDANSWFIIPERLWSLAPKLTCIGLPGNWQIGPPLGHPLDTVMASLDCNYEGMRTVSDNSPLFRLFPPASVGEWAAVRRLHIMITNTWTFVILHWGFIQKDLMIRLSHAYERAGIKFTDSDGISLAQYIVFLITFHWRGRIRRNRFPYHNTNHAPMF